MKFLFLVSDFNQGGITSSLINLSTKLIEKKHIVHILNLPKSHDLPSGFNSNIKLIGLDKKASLFNIHNEDLKKAVFVKKVPLIFLGIAKKILGNKWYNFCFSRMVFDTDYDVAIAYRQGPVDYYIAKYIVPSKVSIGFYHGDGVSEGDISQWDKCLLYMDKIVVVSKSARKQLGLRYPGLNKRLHVIYNTFCDKYIINKSNDFSVYNNRFQIITVGRIDLTNDKRQDRIIEISKKLINDNIDFQWFVVGGGIDLELFQKMINENNLSSYIVCTGSKDNPYPYIKNSDLFVLTSTNESYGMVVTESLILHTPVVAGFYPALPEILDPRYGILADNSVEGIYQAVKNMILNKELYKEKKNNCVNYRYDSEIPYRQFMELFND